MYLLCVLLIEVCQAVFTWVTKWTFAYTQCLLDSSDIYVCIYIYIYIYMYIYIYIHICIYIYIHLQCVCCVCCLYRFAKRFSRE